MSPPSTAHRQIIRDRFRTRFGASNEQTDSMLMFWGGGSDAGIPLAYTKLNRAARGHRGDGTLVALAEALLYGWRQARTLGALRKKP